MHVSAPSLSMYVPLLQCLQAAVVGEAEDIPRRQAEHDEAPDDTTPVSFPFSATDPARQAVQTEDDDAE